MKTLKVIAICDLWFSVPKGTKGMATFDEDEEVVTVEWEYFLKGQPLVDKFLIDDYKNVFEVV